MSEKAWAVPEERLQELGWAEQVLESARAAVRDYVSGRAGALDEVLHILLRTDEDQDAVNDPHPLTPEQILSNRPR